MAQCVLADFAAPRTYACAGRIQVLRNMALPEEGRAIITPSSVLQTDNLATRAYRLQIMYQLQSAEKKRECIAKLRRQEANGQLRSHAGRPPAGVGRSSFAAFSRGDRPATRSCVHGALPSVSIAGCCVPMCQVQV